jgi:mannitol/fructose-specific phosphotransferase system IIA component (Ntr-type)
VSVRLGDLVRADDVVFGLREDDVCAAAARLLERTLPLRGFPPAEVRRLVDAVTAREKEMSTDCGDAAIPHARDEALSEFVAAVAVNPDGVTRLPSPRVLFAFLSPQGDRNGHLALLAQISRLARERAKMDAVAKADTAQRVLEVLRSRPA